MTTGLFPNDEVFLREALAETFAAPAADAGANGVHWRENLPYSIVSMVPTRDLAQRLEVLPQSYLRDRNVTEDLKLAVSTKRGKALLDDARDNKASPSSWPEAHYLGPLHPVLEWASDRALAKLGRNEVFAVRGDVDYPTVLLLTTLTNRRGPSSGQFARNSRLPKCQQHVVCAGEGVCNSARGISRSRFLRRASGEPRCGGHRMLTTTDRASSACRGVRCATTSTFLCGSHRAAYRGMVESHRQLGARGKRPRSTG